MRASRETAASDKRVYRELCGLSRMGFRSLMAGTLVEEGKTR